MTGVRDPLAQPEQLIRRVYAYVAYRIGPGPDAEDVVSDVFERALRYRSTYDPRKGPPIAWLIGIARRCLRQSGRPYTVPEAPDVAGANDVAETMVEHLTLAAALATLDDREREIIALRFGSDLTAREIGEILRVRTNTVEVALYRALRRLRATLEGELDAGPVR